MDPGKREEDLQRELRDHLDLEAAEQSQTHGSAEEARQAARRALGNVALIQEDTRAAWRWAWADAILKDVRFGVRLLARTPAFTVVAVLTLALGIGANTAIFSLVNGLMLKPLPYHDPARLVVPATIFPRSNSDRGSVALADVLDWKAQSDLFEAVSFYQPADFTVTGGEQPEKLHALMVDKDFFRVMAPGALLGRTFTPEENLPGAGRVLVLTHRLWMRRFGGDPKVVGSKIELQGVPHTVVGVVPKDSTWPEDAELFRPIGIPPTPPAGLLRRDNHIFQAVARINRGVTIEHVQARLTVMGARLAKENTNRAGTNWKLHPLNEWILGPTLRQTLVVLLGAVLFVLLIACVNVANLLLARSAAREREVAIRGALGAGWRRLASQFLVESFTLAGAGGLAGILLGWCGLKTLIYFAPPDVPRLDQVHVDLRVLAFTTAICALTAVLSGLMPAIHAARLAPVRSFREAGRSATGGLRSARLRGALVVCELAVAMLLLTGAGLLIRSFTRLQHVDPGFPARNLVTMAISLPRARYQGPPQAATAIQQFADGLRRIPGVVNASATSSLPLEGGGFYLGRVFLTEGQPEPPATKDTSGQWSVIHPAYFETLRLPVIQGRAFTDRDTKDSTPVIIVSRRMAGQLFPGQSPLGRRIRSWRDENLYREIVGVVGDVRYAGLSQDIGNNVYVPHTQDTWSSMMLTVRTQGDPNALMPSIRSEIWSHDKKLSIADVKTMDRILDEALARPRFTAFLLGLFAATALMLAAIGIYGVMSYSVAQRTREIGIRMALGAVRGDVLRMIAGRAAALAVTGVVCGVIGAMAVTRLMKTLLFGIEPTDAVTFVTVPAILMAAAIAAAYVPARRATRVNPIVTLRYE